MRWEFTSATRFAEKMKQEEPVRIRGGWKLVASMLCVVGAFVVVAVLSPNRTAGPCTRIGEVAMLRDVPEASGLAVSRRHPGLLWTHNDSRHATELFAVDALGARLGRVRVPIGTRDWEDISAGRCPAGDCLYVADIGDNEFARPSVRVLRIPEPEPGARVTARPDVFTLTYPDGPHNAEGLFVVDMRVYVVTKDRTGVIYRSTTALIDDPDVRMERIGELRLEVVSDAETSRDEQSVVVRNAHDAVVYRTADLIRGGSALSGTRIPVVGLREPQGEGVALDGDVLYLTSERGAWNRSGRLLSLRCSLPSLPLP
jgi:hypothetical protein